MTIKVALLLCLVARVATAQPAPLPAPDLSKVEQLFEKGTKHYDLGEHADAIVAFKQAYQLMPDPSFLFNIGQAYRAQKNCREATAAYKAYLRNAPDEDRAKVEKFIVELADCTRQQEVVARRALPPPRLSRRTKIMRWGGVAAAGVGLAMFGGAFVFSARASDAEGDFQRLCENGCAAAVAVPIEDRGKAASRNALILSSIGGTLVVLGTSAFVYSLIWPHHIVVRANAEGAMISTAVRF